MNAKRFIPVAVLALVLGMAMPAQAIVPGRAGREAVEWVLKQLGKALGKRTAREVLEEVAEYGGREFVERVTSKLLREGGEEALERAGRLAAKHGPDVLRAIDNAPSVRRVLSVLDELPEHEARAAIRRLAGTGGRELARMTEKMGARVLRAEIRHPGVGGRLVQTLGDDGVRLAARLDRTEAVTLAQHADDIAKLPPQLRRGVLQMLYDNTKAMMQWMRRFVEKHPGKVLFTTAATALILQNREAVLGGAEIVFDENGKPIGIRKPGLVDRMVDKVVTPVVSVVRTMLSIAAVVMGLFGAGWLAIKLWFLYRSERRKDRLQAAVTPPPATVPAEPRSSNPD
ncbi:MAG: hypothetical protein D6725_04085 [Planctomycetota bacterium]|nr:MAG: hypothetical protein D6725_04085 [Planctomycetota bacterium]